MKTRTGARKAVAQRPKTVVNNDQGLLSHHDGVFGHLMDFRDHGVFDPSLGRVEVDPSLIDAHNRVLDEAIIEGLDHNCQVGQGGFFYRTGSGGRFKVTTFTGILVSQDVTVHGNTITFRRHGKVFRGRLCKEAESFNFKRVA